MRNKFGILFTLFLITFTTVGLAETGHKKGKVQYIRVHGEAEHPTWAPPIFWFTLEGVTNAGTCRVWNGNVLFVMDSDSALSLVLAAEMADKEIAVRYDDTKLNVENYWCKATYVTLGDSVLLK